jgi:hypothetical protein
VSAPDLFKLDLPGDDQSSDGEVVPFPGSAAPAAVDGPEPKRPLAQWARPVMERVSAGWRTAWIGDGLLGMRPRPVADLARQFWFAPKPYIRDALILRIPYAIYGAPVIAISAVLHLLLLIVGYPSLLAAAGLLVLFLSLFL